MTVSTACRTMRLNLPLDRPHAGMPMGNGEMGVLIFGSGAELELCISLASCWDHRFGRHLLRPFPYQELKALHDQSDVGVINAEFWRRTNRLPMDSDPTVAWWTSSRVGGGRFRLRLIGFASWIELEYGTGTISAQVGGGVVRFDIDLDVNRLWIDDPAGLIASVEAEPMWDRMSGFYMAQGYLPPDRVRTGDSIGWHQPMPDDPGFYAVMRRTDGGWALDAGLDRVGIPPADMPSSDRAGTVLANAGWWSRYWDLVPEIGLPDQFYVRFYRFALYKFAAATHPSGKACSLQGPWLEDYQPAPWSCDYHFNVNVQQVYTLAFQIGAADHLRPLFDLLESGQFMAEMRRNAEMQFGIDNGLILCHAVDDRGAACGGISTGSMLDQVCGGWTALLYWWHYRSTGDLDTLRRRGYPFMRGVMRSIESVLEYSDGRPSIPLAPSAEYGYTFKITIDGRSCDQNLGRDPSNLLTCTHELLKALIAASEALGLPIDPRWEELRRHLPRFSMIDGKVAIWRGQDLDICHRHHSHLSMIYPFDLVDELDKAESQAVDRAIDHWIACGTGRWSEWCYPWAAIIHARWGMPDSALMLLEQWRRLFVNEAMATVYLPQFRGISSHRRSDMERPRQTSEIMQLDGTMAGASALLEMLVHERGGVVRIFPGIPGEWPDASFARIRLGRLEVSATRSGGRTLQWAIRSPVAETVVVEPWPGSSMVQVDLQPGIEWTVAGAEPDEGSTRSGIDAGATDPSCRG